MPLITNRVNDSEQYCQKDLATSVKSGPLLQDVRRENAQYEIFAQMSHLADEQIGRFNT